MSILQDSISVSLKPSTLLRYIPRFLNLNSQSIYLHYVGQHMTTSSSHQHKSRHPINHTVVVNYQRHSLCPFKDWAHNRGQRVASQHIFHRPYVPTYETDSCSLVGGHVPCGHLNHTHAHCPNSQLTKQNPKQMAERGYVFEKGFICLLSFSYPTMLLKYFTSFLTVLDLLGWYTKNKNNSKEYTLKD